MLLGLKSTVFCRGKGFDQLVGGKCLDKLNYFFLYVNNNFFIWRIITFIRDKRVKIQQYITWVNIINFTGVKINLSIS